MTDLSEFMFDLPEELIALRPAVPRDAARLLHVDSQNHLHDLTIKHLTSLIKPGDLLVVNNTKVIPAQLFGKRHRDGLEAKIALTLHKRLTPSRWSAFAKPGRKLNVGDNIIIGPEADVCSANKLKGRVTSKGETDFDIEFELSGPDLDFAILNNGVMPLPPYIAGKRPADTQDKDDYQTYFASQQGAVAAPTAGLHLTKELTDQLTSQGTDICELTLHVGAGTFLPVKVEDITTHKMHAEWGEITEETADKINETKNKGGRIIAVGTTSLRLLESAAAASGSIKPMMGETDIFITPGYKFKVVDALITNFHLPGSTLFMLVCALLGIKAMRQAYAHAIAQKYRFYSYGDACFLEKTDG